MPWDSKAADLGFGNGAQKPWLPIDEAQRPYAVDRQRADAGSLLQHYRHLLAWRRQHRARVAEDRLPRAVQVHEPQLERNDPEQQGRLVDDPVLPPAPEFVHLFPSPIARSNL